MKLAEHKTYLFAVSVLQQTKWIDSMEESVILNKIVLFCLG